MKTSIFTAVDHASAIRVENYPYGGKKTTKIFWVESSSKGDRVVTQTLNPVTGQWNKEKMSIYSAVIVLQIENGFVSQKELSPYADLNTIQDFIEEFKEEEVELFNVFQKQRLGIIEHSLEIKVSYNTDQAQLEVFVNRSNTIHMMKIIEAINTEEWINRMINWDAVEKSQNRKGLWISVIGEKGAQFVGMYFDTFKNKLYEYDIPMAIGKEKVVLTGKLSIRKGDYVSFMNEDNDMVKGIIVKYPDNKTININVDGKISIVDKQSIVAILPAEELVELVGF